MAQKPIPNNMIPTKRSPQLESHSTGIKSFNNNDNNPTNATPAECPKPQRAPGNHARRGERTAKGATAAR